MVLSSDDATIMAQVNQVYSDYVFALDRSDAAGVAACFSPDGVWAISGRDPIEGRAAIEAVVEATSGDRPRHQYANLGLVAREDGHVRCRAYFSLMGPGDGTIVAYGEYADELIADPDQPARLVFARRNIAFLWLHDSYAKRGRAGRSDEDGSAGG